MLCNELRGCRPFPIDYERKERCLDVLEQLNMTITELALHLNIKKSNLSNVISGRELSPTMETRIATFLNTPREFLFPPRTAQEIANMRKAEAEQKACAEKMKAERMEIRRKALGVKVWNKLSEIKPEEKHWIIFKDAYTEAEIAEYELEEWESVEIGIGYVTHGQICSWWDAGATVVSLDNPNIDWLWKYVEV